MRDIIGFVFACMFLGVFSALPAGAQFFEDDFSTNPFGDIAEDIPRRWCERYHHVHWDNDPESSTFNAMLGVDGTCCGGWTLCGGCWAFEEVFPGSIGGSCSQPIEDPLTCPDQNSSTADGCRHLLISEHNYPGQTRRAIIAFGLPVPLSADCIATCAGCPVESVRVAAAAHPHCDASIEARVIRESSNYRLQIVATTTPRVGYPECALALSETYNAPSTFSLLNTPTTRYRLNVQTSPSATFPLTKLFVRATLVDRVSAATIASLDVNDVTRPAWYDVEGRRFAFGGVFPTDFTATAPTFDDFFGLPAEPEASPTPGPSPTPSPTPSPSPSPTPPASTCGNGSLDSPEICDGEELAGHSCVSVGFLAGTLACASDCSGLDTRECDLPATPPIDPQITAPPIDTSVATEFGLNVEFLYLGSERVQYGVVEGVIADRRAAVVRGRILDLGGNGLPMAEVRVLRHPELGATLSREDGRFDMVVNGGGPLTLTYAKPGYLTVHRTVNVPWQDYVVAHDAVMIEKDSEATEITLSQMNGIVVHESSLILDDDGDGPAAARQAKLVFFPGTTATMNTPTGSQNIDHLTVRATEYTVGERGLERMPAELPPNTAYTYAVEFSVDEAEQNDASGVTFSGEPVVFYIENFLDIPATNDEGGVDVPVKVPVGYYDREAGVWVPAESGRIVTIVSTSGTPTKADVDTDGNGSADNEGISDAEREALVGSQLYGMRALPLSLWRVELFHFSPWDCNWPYGPPPDSGECSCPPPEPARGDLPGDPELSCGSVIGCEPQTLGESVQIVGTPYRLHYQSDRVLGRGAARTLRIPLSGDNPPALTNLRQIDLEISVAGKTYSPEPILIDPVNPVLPTDPYVFTWDGRDAYERVVQGRFPVTVRIGYTYAAVYGRADRFGDNPTATITGSRARNEITFWSTYPSTLENWDARPVGLGGWTLDVHHTYDPESGVLLLGNGQRRMAAAMTRVVETVAGGGSSFADGMPAAEVSVNQPRAIALGADGSLFIGEPSRVLQVRPDGLIYRIAGVASGNAFNGDGPAPATTLRMDGVSDLAIGPDGSIYAAVAHHQRVRRIYRQDGQLWMETFAGSGPCCDGEFQGDGGPATQARLNQPTSIAVAPDGVVYIGDMGNRRIRRVGTDGIITTIAGNGLLGFSPDGTSAIDAHLGSFTSPTSIALDREGILHFVERHASLDNALLRRIRRDGTIETVAGIPGLQENPVEGGRPLQEGLAVPESVSIAEDGGFLISEGTLSVTIPHIVRRLSPRGNVTTVAGVTGARGFAGDSGPARLATFNDTAGVRAGRGDTFYVPDTANDRVRIVRGGLSRNSMGYILVPSEDGREVYVFDPTGRHMRTRDAFTNTEILTFEYDANGRLERVVDAFNNVTAIAHPGGGTFPPTGPGTITAPGGQETNFALDDQNNGYLKSIEGPGGATHYFSYTGDGLLLGRTDPLGHSYEYGYSADGLGRLIRDADPEVLAADPNGSFKSLARDDSSIFEYAVAVTTASGHVASYGVENLADGRVLREERDAATLSETVSVAIDGRRVHTTREGIEIQRVFGPDPRFGMVAPVVTRMDITTPGSLHAVVTESRTAAPTDPAQPLVDWERIVTVNGRSSSRTYDGATRTIIDRSPAGRRRLTTLDPKGKILSTEIEGLWPVSFSYDGHGRVTEIRQGPSNGDAPQRIYTLGYDTVHRDRVTELSNPLLQTVMLGDFTGADVPQTVTLPDLATIGLAYDANGNVTSITPPSRPSHSFAYSDVDLLESYTPPQVTPPIVDRQTSSLRQLDRRLESVIRPGGEVLQLEYDPVNGRLTGVVLPPGEGSLTYGYDPDTGQLATITGPLETANRPTIAFEYDGWLNTSAKWACEEPVPSCPSGTVSGEVERTYDDNFLPLTQRINGGSEVTFVHDADGLLTAAGAFTITRDTDPNHGHGNILGTALGGVTDVRTYNQFGELETYTASYNGTPIFEATYLLRDGLGRITQLVERISQGTPEVSDYAYDTRGRLDLVTRDGQVADYGYDSNGNRTVAPNLLSSATYDEQDRLRDYGGITYAYSDDGEVTSRTEGGQATLFEYDALGSLRSVERPGEPIIEYVNDGLGRRVGKKVGGALVKGWLYDDRLRIVAELDGANTVVSRFVYGTRINVPDYGVIQGQMYRFITDHLGSVRLVVDAASGAIVQRIDYDEFGNAVLVTGSWGMHPFGFAGGLADADTGLVRFGSRDYDASVGRWMARDPSLFRGSKANLYEYVSSDPVNFFDPFGATQCDIDVAIDVCKRANPDRDYPADIQADLHDPLDEQGQQELGRYIYIPLVWEDISLNDKYLLPLDDENAYQLLNSLLHELIHANDPWYKNLNDLFDREHPDVYRKAAEEAKRLKEQYLAERAARCGGQ